MRRFLIIAAALTAVTTSLAGCGTKSANETEGGPGGSSGNQASCDLAPASLVKETLGLDVDEPSPTDLGASVLVCIYVEPGSPPCDWPTCATVFLRIGTATNADTFKTGRDLHDDTGNQTEDYPGFGDEAYTFSQVDNGVTRNVLVARTGTFELMVKATASFDQERALEQKVFDALG